MDLNEILHFIKQGGDTIYEHLFKETDQTNLLYPTDYYNYKQLKTDYLIYILVSVKNNRRSVILIIAYEMLIDSQLTAEKVIGFP